MSINRQRQSHIAAVDLGTTQVVVALAEWGSEGCQVVGVGRAPSLGMKQRAVVHIEAMTEAVRLACEQVEPMAGVSIDSVWLGVGGLDISSFESSGMVVIRDKVVDHGDIEKVVEVAQAVFIPNDRCILHVLPKSYKVDNQSGIYDPMGMSGSRLETQTCIITGSQAAIQNSVRCVRNAGLKISGLVVQSLASSLAVLTEDEKSMGVTVADIGGGVCDLITYHQGHVVHSGVIPLGGINFTNDVTLGLRTTWPRAEEIKKKWGHVFPDKVDEGDIIMDGDETLKKKVLCTVLEARCEELFNWVLSVLQEDRLVSQLGSGLVVTGGVSHMGGFVELGDFLLDIPVRQGLPIATLEPLRHNRELLQPAGSESLDEESSLGIDPLQGGEFATVFGLLNYAYQEQQKKKKMGTTFVKKWHGVTSRVRDYFNGLF